MNALVTGSSSGLGLAVALELASAGMPVAIADCKYAETDTDGTLNPNVGGSAIDDFHRLDLLEARIKRALREAAAVDGQLDVVVCNSHLQVFPDFDSLETEEWQTAILVDLLNAHYLLKHVPRFMAPDGMVCIVFAPPPTGSTYAQVVYAAASSAMVDMARIGSTRSRLQRVHVNIVFPWSCDSPDTSGDRPEIPIREEVAGDKSPYASVVAAIMQIAQGGPLWRPGTAFKAGPHRVECY
ncbi:SDR family oxidoreductase [Noviherbaspirillum sp.]|uniref:SDR family oxidoreductase n=1 Tax=Noviherbaspirillum sp. TaxID=1926288 RepID=UPI002FE12441